MINAHMDLSRGGTLLATLTWHKKRPDGTFEAIGVDFTDAADDEIRERVIAVCNKPINLTQGGVATGKAFPGSSKHFENLRPHLERLGCRVRSYV